MSTVMDKYMIHPTSGPSLDQPDLKGHDIKVHKNLIYQMILDSS